MATLQTVTIPQVTVHQGTPQVFGPGSVPVGVTWAEIDVLRTAGTHSLNSLGNTDALKLLIEISLDGGVTWQDPTPAILPGGIHLDRLGNQINTQKVWVQPIGGDSGSTIRQGRATLTALQPQVSVSGTLTLGN